MTYVEWRDIPGYEDLYKVSQDGQVWSLVSNKTLKTPVGVNGYKVVNLRRGGKTVQKTVHSLVLEAFVGLRPSGGHVACHGNGVRTDNRVSNLRWGTYGDNVRDSVRHGTYDNGTKGMTHCRRGHALADWNVLKRTSSRTCASCANARTYTYRNPGTWLTMKEVSDADFYRRRELYHKTLRFKCTRV